MTFLVKKDLIHQHGTIRMAVAKTRKAEKAKTKTGSTDMINGSNTHGKMKPSGRRRAGMLIIAKVEKANRFVGSR